MTESTHREMVNFIWDICNILRGPYKRNEYRKVILPMTILSRFDSVLEPTKDAVQAEFEKLSGKSELIIQAKLKQITGVDFYNTSKLTFEKLLDDPNQIASNLNSYISGFSENVRIIIEKLDFDDQIRRMAERNLLFLVIKRFVTIKEKLSPARVSNLQMGYIFEELIRIGAEQSNEEAGDHFTPREVIRLMVNLLLSTEEDLNKSHVVKTIFDPTSGTGGMISVAEQYMRELNQDAKPMLFGQDFNNESWAICRADMIIKGENAENIILGDSLTEDGFADSKFDYMLANPPFGVSWQQQQAFVQKEADSQGYGGRFGAGLPRINDGALLFLQHMISKMERPQKGGSRIAIVFNGSPLFTGDAGSGESDIRRWIIENDWLEAIVGMPDQLFYNTGISTYVWIVTNRKEARRKGKIQLIDARNFYVKMRKSLGNKRNRIGDGEDGTPDQIRELTTIYGNFVHNQKRSFTPDGHEKELVVSKVFDNEDFGYRKITIERPLRLNFTATAERLARLEQETEFTKLATSAKKDIAQKLLEIEQGQARQETIRQHLRNFASTTGEKLYTDRKDFLKEFHKFEKTQQVKLNTAEMKAVVSALGERDETATICYKASGEPEADPQLRDTEIVPLKEALNSYFEREVLPHAPDAWIDHSKTKTGYEIPFNREFYTYEPPRDLEIIEAEMKTLEAEILDLLHEVTNGKGE
jgi:type I restriction enzyme M protein